MPQNLPVAGSPVNSPVPFTVGDLADRRTLAHALEQGYRITLDGDGTAEVTSPQGETYHVAGFSCDCPDALARRGGSFNGHCKHSFFVAQCYPCDSCGSTQYLGSYTTAFGEVLHRYECGKCRKATDFSLVYGKRLLAKARRRAVA